MIGIVYHTFPPPSRFFFNFVKIFLAQANGKASTLRVSRERNSSRLVDGYTKQPPLAKSKGRLFGADYGVYVIRKIVGNYEFVGIIDNLTYKRIHYKFSNLNDVQAERLLQDNASKIEEAEKITKT